MRIASLLPSATEIVYALGLGDSLVAVTHECDYPPAARSHPPVTRSLLPQRFSSARIDSAVRKSARDVHTIYELDSDRLVELAPDVVLTQSLCEVCAVPRSVVDGMSCSLPAGARVVSMDPRTLDGVLEGIEVVGDALGVPARAATVVAALRHRLDTVEASVAGLPPRRVFCCEWLDPVYRAGHWVPQQVSLAGGDDPLGRAGEPSTPVPWQQVLDCAPDVVVLMPCGFNTVQSAARAGEIAGREGWESLPAVRRGEVYAVDGSGYFSRPGPRLVRGVEILAAILHPEAFPPPPQTDALRVD
jgi:iron complex transport system substrate-binding protein